MPLIDSLIFTQDTDIATGVVADASDYGVGGNPARSAKANYLLWSKTDKNGVRTFSNPSQGNVLSNLSYAVATATDGHYEGILMRFDIYDNGTAYDEDDAVYDNGSVYRATQATTGNLPTDANFWEVVSDLSTLISNSSVDVYIEDFYIKVRASQCVNSKFTNMDNCGCSKDLYSISGALQLKAMLITADLAFADDNPSLMEKIISEINATCSEC